MFTFFAATARGFEHPLSQELAEIGASEIKENQGGVYFKADLEIAYKVQMWSRLASRLLLVLYQGKAEDIEAFYQACYWVDWPSLFSEKSSFVVEFNGSNNFINNTQFGALKLKDAIVDRFRDDGYKRPDVSRDNADIRLWARVRKDNVSIGINFSGGPMHQRGYRSGTGEAPLKETLACAMLARSGWAKQKSDIIDPFCGSGTILIEAAMWAADVAPGLGREHVGFEHWRGHNAQLWQQTIDQAIERAEAGVASCQYRFYGSDVNERVIEAAKSNAENAGVQDLIEFKVQDALAFEVTSEQPGMLLSNPPFGERLGSFNSLLQLYFQFGQRCKQQLGGWRMSLLSSEAELLSAMKLKYDKTISLFNGPLECSFNNYRIHAQTDTQAVVNLEQVAPAFVNRIKKNRKQIEKWAKKLPTDCYRIYDADIPEYNVAVDYYQGYLVVQEYAAPAKIPEHTARKRFNEVILALPFATGIDANKIFAKVRKKQKGAEQYERHEQESVILNVTEFGAKFKVNLTEYLDTGLFLDHRLTRHMLGQKAKGKKALNLFAYTGSASVHMALGGATSVTTVDMSRTYLNWAEDNFNLNNIANKAHKFVQADVLAWIKNNQEKFDLIFIDPPTFSNSKRMDGVFDVQEDHVNLLTQLANALNPGGEIVFSNNKRKFKMDIETLNKAGIVVEALSDKTLPLDYKRNPHIHNCWSLRNE
ncbi:bifunctional 23S rRNA (guanine(2069)-N(7))-methyltransferase RlmK/23S rRNA (guanine(2445)-N(2))-methyltransferase RlmL [Paraferrimonas sp. SM1919]|uniref:bifunctional 23S rRNA (guanine(2069)-N(7))-methyltransferase RlmK/23S rRNA (guanine(2445)-N(2))-methyltransferase RlmL n=1 Tax=Paraferrimonas sp. SM1919 TaxID=2662263 RepID=UPI0013D1311C|nr:bifunctional 23S rRNA (guanine(2069)-N(7))-methyltransferase RlmK/23S rRNA (guanine(2445)-N(2))-methyltransferase RlmL [Paraferrimonas sp. SM1919]